MPIKFRNDVTVKEVRRLFDYDQKSGDLVWKFRKETSRGDKVFNKQFAGKVAGCLKPDGCVAIKVLGVPYLAHRLAWLHQYGVWPKEELDHKHGKRADNRISKMREASHAEQRQNQKLYDNNKTGFPGVFQRKTNGKYMAYVRFEGKMHYFGDHYTAEDAFLARSKGKVELHKFQPTSREVTKFAEQP